MFMWLTISKKFCILLGAWKDDEKKDKTEIIFTELGKTMRSRHDFWLYFFAWEWDIVNIFKQSHKCVSAVCNYCFSFHSLIHLPPSAFVVSVVCRKITTNCKEGFIAVILYTCSLIDNDWNCLWAMFRAIWLLESRLHSSGLWKINWWFF